ncbi:prostatic acid phosphatase-like isoform X2 [Neocloeon triangulifer]|nr:prostatic acid phosphatase-like isoform X2 [Neocloeon triangulifer]XP_059474788.1 prostatic acid phosphatase-like isoform X2 [Neocloeon triangulifer]
MPPLLIILAITCAASLAQDQNNYDVDDPSTVILTNIIFRHGDRTPVDPYPTDPYRNVSVYWPEGLGQLTDVGKEQHYRLGQYFRKRYSTLLPKKYNLNDVLVRSTDVDRTLMSAESNLAGFFPPVNQWDADLKWSPIPVHTVPETLDKLVSMKYPCPRYESELKKLMESDYVKKLNAQYQDVYDYLTEHSGRKIQDPTTLQYIFNTMWIENLKNMELPNWTKKVFPDRMKDLAAISFSLNAYTEEMKRLKGGPLVGEIVQHMKQKKEKTLTPNRKLFLYSAHDTTVANILMTLGIFDTQIPAYTSSIILELHKLPAEKYAVSILFKNETKREPYKLTLPGCSFRCPLDDFVKLTASMIPEDWMAECQLGTEQTFLASDEAKLLRNLSITVVIGSGIVVLLLISLLVLAIAFLQQRNRNNNFRYSPLSHNLYA